MFKLVSFFLVPFMRSINIKALVVLILFVLCFKANSQILNDSTVQFVAYWRLHETQTYRLNQNSYKVKNGDTLNRETINYDAELTIIDSLASNYIIKWTYKNFDYKTENKFIEKLMKIAENMSVIYSTDEYGAFQEVKNFDEIKKYMDRGFDTLLVEFKSIPNIGPIVNQVRKTFSTKEAIEAAAINELHYFHAPFGSKCALNMIYKGEKKLPNIYGGEPFDAKVQTDLVQIDTANSSSMIRIVTTVDSTQAKQATIAYLKQISKASNLPEPTIDKVPEISIQSRFASDVHLPSGWVLDAYDIKEVISGNEKKVDEVQITLK